MTYRKIVYYFIIIIFSAQMVIAQEVKQKTWSEQPWAIGMAHRSAYIPFTTEGEKYVGTIVPLIFFQGERFYFRGIEGGYKFYENDTWRFSAIGRLRFFDFPEEYQNRIQGDELHGGLQARYKPIGLSFLDFELMSDWQLHYSTNIRLGLDQNFGNMRFTPHAEVKLKSKKFNSYYYGLTVQDINAGMELSAGIIANLRVWTNLYLYGSVKLTYLEKKVRDVEFVNNKFVPEFFIGAGFSNDHKKIRKDELSISPYIRVSHGWASVSSLNEILRFQNISDPYNNRLTSVFYGHPLTDNLFSLPIDIYLTSGFVWHWKSSVQGTGQEVVLGIQFYFTIPWPVRWRIGFGEGWSYANQVPYVEKDELEGKDYRPSKLLNYLNPTIDINIGDIFGGEQLKHWWLGYSLHHRSGIFGTSQLFGRISGGGNYNTVYLLYHF